MSDEKLACIIGIFIILINVLFDLHRLLERLIICGGIVAIITITILFVWLCVVVITEIIKEIRTWKE